MNDSKLVNTVALATSAKWTVLFLTALIITADLWVPLKNLLRDVFTHHWIGKSVVGILFFVLVYAIARGTTAADEESAAKTLGHAAWTAIVCALVLVGFFLYETAAK